MPANSTEPVSPNAGGDRSNPKDLEAAGQGITLVAASPQPTPQDQPDGNGSEGMSQRHQERSRSRTSGARTWISRTAEVGPGFSERDVQGQSEKDSRERLREESRSGSRNRTRTRGRNGERSRGNSRSRGKPGGVRPRESSRDASREKPREAKLTTYRERNRNRSGDRGLDEDRSRDRSHGRPKGPSPSRGDRHWDRSRSPDAGGDQVSDDLRGSRELSERKNRGPYDQRWDSAKEAPGSNVWPAIASVPPPPPPVPLPPPVASKTVKDSNANGAALKVPELPDVPLPAMTKVVVSVPISLRVRHSSTMSELRSSLSSKGFKVDQGSFHTKGSAARVDDQTKIEDLADIRLIFSPESQLLPWQRRVALMTMQKMAVAKRVFGGGGWKGPGDAAKSIFYKTGLCNVFMNNQGRCLRGDNCVFAHGQSELRSRPMGILPRPAGNIPMRITSKDATDDKADTFAVDEQETIRRAERARRFAARPASFEAEEAEKAKLAQDAGSPDPAMLPSPQDMPETAISSHMEAQIADYIMEMEQQFLSSFIPQGFADGPVDDDGFDQGLCADDGYGPVVGAIFVDEVLPDANSN